MEKWREGEAEAGWDGRSFGLVSPPPKFFLGAVHLHVPAAIAVMVLISRTIVLSLANLRVRITRH